MNNLNDYFENLYNSNKLVQSYLIGNVKFDDIKDDLYSVINKYIFNSDSNIEENPDLYVYKADEEIISKEDIKTLIKDISTTSQFHNAKVYILDKCEELSDFAYNAILKTLEEPEEGIYAILLTTNMDMVKPTIASRCQKIFISSNVEKEDFDELCIELGDNLINYIENDGIKTIFNHPDIYNKIDDRNVLLNVIKYLLEKYKKELDNYIYDNESDSIIYKNNDIERISKKILIINDNINKLNSYLNKNLSIDRFIIEMSRC